MDFGALPPEINSARMYAGAGPGPLTEAASAWSTLSTELSYMAVEHTSVITALTATWSGPSSLAAASSLGTYGAWLTSTAAQAEATIAQAVAAVEAYGSAFAATVPPPVIAANRAQLTMLVVTNLLGQNTPAIAANEAAYAEMWAQDAAAMYAYAASSSTATSGLPQFTPAPRTTGGSTTSPEAGILGSDSVIGQYLQALVSSGVFVQIPIDLLVGLLALSAADTVVIGQDRATAAIAGIGSSAPTILSAPGSTTVEAPVRATAGASAQIGRLNAPPSWARSLPQVEPGPARPILAKVSGPRAAIPAVPFMPVTSAGRSKQGRVREDPEYGAVSKVLPPRHPAGG